jgi:hypothetical protein
MMFPHSFAVPMPRFDRPLAKGSDFTGQGFSVSMIQEPTLMGYCSHMIWG